MKFQNLVDLLQYRSKHQTNENIYTFLASEQNTQHINYAELAQQAQKIGAALQAAGMKGERAMLLYQPSLEYINAFLGCQYAGTTAVPVYAPTSPKSLPRLLAIAQDAQIKVVLSTENIINMAKMLLAANPGLNNVQWIATDTLDQQLANDWQMPKTQANDVSFLQYTSGSTATPKGVMVTHQNILHNSKLIAECFGHHSESQGVIWLPPYHDMGLIGGIIQPLYVGFPVALMSPYYFVQKPLRWFQAISKYGATTSGGPNFSYDLCLKKIKLEDCEGIDLHTWQVAFNGGEPVREETQRRFSERFAPLGFRKTTFLPCYGMAETTLIVSGCPLKEEPTYLYVKKSALNEHEIVLTTAEDADAHTLVSSGVVLDEDFQQVIAVDEDTMEACKEGEIGEIWVHSKSVARGYWNKPDKTMSGFYAQLADDDTQTNYLRTGDLGFIYEGQVYITGRVKDLIIIRGRNYYPQDLELTMQKSHASLRLNCGAAFTIDENGQEALVLAQEIKRDFTGDLAVVRKKINAALSVQHGLRARDIVFLKAASLPRTSSGKVRRFACRRDFLRGKLREV